MTGDLFRNRNRVLWLSLALLLSYQKHQVPLLTTKTALLWEGQVLAWFPQLNPEVSFPKASATLRKNDICARSRKEKSDPFFCPLYGSLLSDALGNASCLSRGIAQLSYSKRLVSDPCQDRELAALWLTNSPAQLGFPE